MVEPGRVLAGRYRLEEKLGEGGMGVVFRGTDLGLERAVAVKLLRGGEANANAQERFLREAKRTAQLRHPGIVEVFDIGQTEEGDAFFVMELLEGEPLSARLRKNGRLLQAETVRIGVQICDALQCAHDKGIVHRDLKPANVMLVGSEGQVKVLDFGVAKQLDATTKLTESGMLVGTAEYMAPESIKGARIDARADIYSLGAVLYKMLSGVPVFEASNVATLVHAHLTTTPRRMRERVPEADVTDEMDAVVRRCLAKDPDARFGTMHEVKSAILAAHEQKVAPPAPPPRVPLPPRSPPGEREIELEEPSHETPIEIEEVERKPSLHARPDASQVVPPRMLPEAAPSPDDLARAPGSQPSGAAPTGEVSTLLAELIPPRAAKGLLVGSLVALVVLHGFFGGGVLSTLVLLAVAAASGIAVRAHHR